MKLFDFIKGIVTPISKEKPATTSVPKRKPSSRSKKKSGSSHLAKVTRPEDVPTSAIVVSRKVPQGKQETALSDMILPISPYLSRPILIETNKDSQTETIQSILPVKLIRNSDTKALKG